MARLTINHKESSVICHQLYSRGMTVHYKAQRNYLEYHKLHELWWRWSNKYNDKLCDARCCSQRIMCWRWDRARKALRVYKSKIHFQHSKILIKIFNQELGSPWGSCVPWSHLVERWAVAFLMTPHCCKISSWSKPEEHDNQMWIHFRIWNLEALP